MENVEDKKPGLINPGPDINQFNFVVVLALAGLFVSLYLLNNMIIPDSRRCYSLVSLPHDNVAFVPVPEAHQCDSIPLIDEIKAEVAEHGIVLEKSTITYNQNPKLLVWVLLFSMMIATTAGFLPAIFSKVRDIIKTFAIKTNKVILYGVAIVAFGVMVTYVSGGSRTGKMLSAFLIIDHFTVLVKSTFTLNLLIGFSIACGVLALYGMLMINLAATKISHERNEAFVQYTLLKESLQFFLTSLSILILYSVIVTAMLQQALETVIHVENMTLFPSEFIYSYGLVFTIFLSIIYIPVHQHLQIRRQRLSENLNADELSSDKWKSILERESIEKSLGAFLSILAPLLGSAFSEVVKHISQ